MRRTIGLRVVVRHFEGVQRRILRRFLFCWRIDGKRLLEIGVCYINVVPHGDGLSVPQPLGRGRQWELPR